LIILFQLLNGRTLGELTFGFKNTFIINLSDDTSNVVLRLNILALAILIYLTRVLNKIYDDQELTEAIEEQKVDKAEQGADNEN